MKTNHISIAWRKKNNRRTAERVSLNNIYNIVEETRNISVLAQNAKKATKNCIQIIKYSGFQETMVNKRM